MNQSLFSVKEISSFLSVHPKTLYKWTEEGKIPFLKINGLIRFKKHEIDEWGLRNQYKLNKFSEFLPKLDLSLETYDRMLLKGRSVLSKNSKRWNYGIGSVYTRKTKGGKDRWYIDYNVSGVRKRQVVKDAQTRAEAVIALQEKVAEAFDVSHNSRTRKPKTKFRELADLYINDYAKINKRSWKDDMYRIEAHMKLFFGDCELQNITPLMIEKYRAERLKTGVSKSTVNREITIMKKMFNLAIDWNLANTNPVAKVKLFSEKDTQKERILSKEEEAALLAKCPDYLRPIVIVALNTGMRRGEILNLRWKQIDFERRQIKIVQTKSGKHRVIPVNDVLFQELMKIKKANQIGEYVFSNPKTGLPYIEVKKSFKNACRKAGIEDLRFHDLRHTFATRLIASGVDIVTIRDLLGHFSVRITQRYTHSNQNQMRAAVQLLSRKVLKSPRIEENLAHICHICPGKESEESITDSFSIN